MDVADGEVENFLSQSTKRHPRTPPWRIRNQQVIDPYVDTASVEATVTVVFSSTVTRSSIPLGTPDKVAIG